MSPTTTFPETVTPEELGERLLGAERTEGEFWSGEDGKLRVALKSPVSGKWVVYRQGPDGAYRITGTQRV